MDTKIYMAPLSGISDLSFRLISRGMGAAYCFFEMLDSRSTLNANPKHRGLLKTIKKDSPIAAQLVGPDPSIMLDAALKLCSFVDISSLDINAACPARKIIRKGAGAALLENTATLGKIIKKLASKLPIPVTVKLRTACHKIDMNKFIRTAKMCQANGASTIFIHGRTASQGYSGDIDYPSIKAAKQALKIPVFGSGNILNAYMAKKMVDETGCDGILVARGAFGNPWIFKNIENYLKSGKSPKYPSLTVKKKTLKKHLAYIKKYKDISERGKIGFMGKVTMWYLKGLYNSRVIRARISRIRTHNELIDLIDSVSAPPGPL